MQFMHVTYIFPARSTYVHSSVLLSYVVCPSARPSCLKRWWIVITYTEIGGK